MTVGDAVGGAVVPVGGAPVVPVGGAPVVPVGGAPVEPAGEAPVDSCVPWDPWYSCPKAVSTGTDSLYGKRPLLPAHGFGVCREANQA